REGAATRVPRALGAPRCTRRGRPRETAAGSAVASQLSDTRRSPAGDRGHDADRLAVGDRGVDALQEADVLVGEEHVDKAPQAAGLVEETLFETRVRAVERLQRFRDRARLDRHLAGIAREVAQLRWDADGDTHVVRTPRCRTPRGTRRAWGQSSRWARSSERRPRASSNRDP